MKTIKFSIIFTVLIIIHSCTMVKITVSEKRNLKPKEIEIGENTTIKTCGIIKVNKTHFSPSGFRIKSGDRIIYIDPVEREWPDYFLFEPGLHFGFKF